MQKGSIVTGKHGNPNSHTAAITMRRFRSTMTSPAAHWQSKRCFSKTPVSATKSAPQMATNDRIGRNDEMQAIEHFRTHLEIEPPTRTRANNVVPACMTLFNGTPWGPPSKAFTPTEIGPGKAVKTSFWKSDGPLKAATSTKLKSGLVGPVGPLLARAPLRRRN